MKILRWKMALSFISLQTGKTETSRQNIIPTQYPKETFELNSIDKYNANLSFDFEQQLVSFPKHLFCLTMNRKVVQVRWFVYFLMLFDLTLLAMEFFWLDVDPPDLSPLVSTRSLSKISLMVLSSLTAFFFFGAKSVSTDYTEINEKSKALNLNADEYFTNNITNQKKIHRNIFSSIQIGFAIFFILYLTLVLKISLPPTASDVFMICDALMNWYRIMIVLEKFYDLIVSSLLVRISFESLTKDIYKMDDSDWTSEVLGSYRETYFKNIELTTAVNRIWATFLGFIYPLIPMLGVLFFYWFLIQPNHPVRIVFLISISASIFTVFHLISRNLIAINVEAASVYDPIFRTTLFNKKTEYIVEVSGDWA